MWVAIDIFSNYMSVATEIFPVAHILQLRISTYIWVVTEIFPNCMSVATEIFPVAHMLQLRISSELQQIFF
jgi:hypothetical protein